MLDIRKTKKDDIEAIVKLEKKLLGETLGCEMLEAELSNECAHFHTITCNEQVIGYIGAWIIEETCEIINFVVDERFQHQGYGQQLLSVLIQKARALKVTELILDVKETNQQALNFYFRQNFEKISERKDYYADKTTALVLRKELL